MRVAMSGSTGYVGLRLTERLRDEGHEVHALVRGSVGDREIGWKPSEGLIDAAGLEGMDAVVHLAGESIAEGRWNEAKKARIRTSRVQGTALLATTLAGLSRRPRVLVSASAVGFYGDRGDERLDEASESGHDFLADTCRSWEDAAKPASAAGIRVVHPRIGVVLGPDGGALAKMLTPFKLGLGGRLGSGRQWMSWVDREDLCSIILKMIEDDGLRGPVCAVAPGAVRNQDFTKTLGRVLGRPTIFSIPTVVAKLAFGEMAEALLLASQHVEPAKLKQQGFDFRFPDLESSLRHALRRD